VQENTQPILVDDPRVLAIPIRECGEPLVDLCEYPLLTTTSHPKARSEAETRLHCREGVAQRLLRADARLPEGIRLLIVECHRPLELQDAYWKDQLESLRERHPDWPEDKLATENAKFVAPPEIVPPHSTGGAVDLVLAGAEGEELDMGSALNEKGPLMRTDARGLRQGLPEHPWLCACLLGESSPHCPQSSRPPTGSLNNSHCSRTRNLKKVICSIADGPTPISGTGPLRYPGREERNS
jgi:zinc D-Ala-D-Ala dipeptidase